MRNHALAAILATLLAQLASAVCADEERYIVEPPDVLRLDVTGLSKKAQPVKGEFIVRPDGTISLGDYGDVSVAGLTLEQSRETIAKRLSAHAKKNCNLQVGCRLSAANSKAYYVIGPGKRGAELYRFPATGRETVADAILQVKGLSAAAAQGRVWVASPSGKVRNVDWRAITRQGRPDTNYKLKSGDRVHVEASPPK